LPRLLVDLDLLWWSSAWRISGRLVTEWERG
jgi:hypothetical protein